MGKCSAERACEQLEVKTYQIGSCFSLRGTPDCGMKHRIQVGSFCAIGLVHDVKNSALSAARHAKTADVITGAKMLLSHDEAIRYATRTPRWYSL
jgi:hypothetical protein